MNLHAQIMPAVESADFRLLISAIGDDGRNVATIASISIDDPNLQVRLRDIAQAFRMGARFGKEA
jgi:hypothetical protein